MDGKADRRKRLAKGLSFALFLGTVEVLGLYHGIPSNFAFLSLVGAAYTIYLNLVLNGLFSVYDTIGWFSPPGSSSSRKTRDGTSSPLTVIQPDSRASTRRVGIVLAGGGGKGAYQIGCWKAIQRRGLRIDAVAGTSVGALNAVMIARRDPALTEYTEYIWRHMSASRLGRLDVVRLLFSPWTYASYRQRYRGDRLPPSVLPLTAAVLVVTVCVAWYLKSQIQWSFSEPSGHWISWIWVAVLIVYLVRLLVVGAMAAGLIAMAPGVIDIGPTQRLVKEMVPPGTFKASTCKCFVTTAERKLLYDRDDPHHDRGPIHQRRAGRRFEPRIVYSPVYWPLDKAESDIGIVGTHLILAMSAALPILFEVFRIKNNWHFDGALADRLPIRPLLDYGCRRIFIIHLDATGRDVLDGRCFEVLTREGLVAKLEWQARLQRLARDYTAAQDAAVQRSGLVALAQPSRPRDKTALASEIIHVVPSRDLGTFLTGTMNFTGRKARWLIELGDRDMTRILDALDASRA
ncbi:MAG: patatin-like phospholipase family protein [Roseiarcus sp.]